MAKETTNTDAPATDTAVLAKILERLVEREPAGVTSEQLEKILEGNAQSTRKALRPEQETHPDISDFNPKGERDHPRPRLLHKVIFCGMELHEDELKVGEIELYNRFTHSCLARNGSWRAEVKPAVKGGKGELHIIIPVATTDDRMELPNGMSLILSELLGGTKAVDPASLAERVAELEKQLANSTA